MQAGPEQCVPLKKVQVAGELTRKTGCHDVCGCCRHFVFVPIANDGAHHTVEGCAARMQEGWQGDGWSGVAARQA